MTILQIRDLVKSKLEETSKAELLLDWCEKNQGKRLTVKNCPEGFKISKQYTMTHLVELVTHPQYGYLWPNGINFLLGHKTVNVLIPTPTEFSRLNSCYLSAAYARNEKRLNFLDSEARMTKVNIILNNFIHALNLLQTEVFNGSCPDVYDIIRLALEDNKGIPGVLHFLGNLKIDLETGKVR